MQICTTSVHHLRTLTRYRAVGAAGLCATLFFSLPTPPMLQHAATQRLRYGFCSPPPPRAYTIERVGVRLRCPDTHRLSQAFSRVGTQVQFVNNAQFCRVAKCGLTRRAPASMVTAVGCGSASKCLPRNKTSCSWVQRLTPRYNR